MTPLTLPPAAAAVAAAAAAAGWAFAQRGDRNRVLGLLADRLGASRDVPPAIRLGSQLQHSVGFASSALQCGLRERVLGTCLGRVLIQRAPLDSTSCRRPRLVVHQCHCRRLTQALDIGAQPVITPKLSYNSNALARLAKKLSVAKLGAIHCSASIAQARASKKERCVASSRSQPSRAPRPT